MSLFFVDVLRVPIINLALACCSAILCIELEISRLTRALLMYGSGKDRTWTEKRPPTIGLCVNNRQPAQRMGCPAIVSTELLFIAMFYYSYGSCYCIIGKLIADDAPADNIDSTSMIGTLATSFLVLQAVACVDYSNNHENSNDDYFCKNIIHSTWYVRAGTDPPLSLVPC